MLNPDPVALPFVPSSVSAASKKPPTSTAPPAKRKQAPSISSPDAGAGSNQAAAAAPSAAEVSAANDEAPAEKKRRLEADFSAQMRAQIQAEKDYGITYAYDTRPKPPRGGKGRNKKSHEASGQGVQFDVTKYSPAVSCAISSRIVAC